MLRKGIHFLSLTELQPALVAESCKGGKQLHHPSLLKSIFNLTQNARFRVRSLALIKSLIRARFGYIYSFPLHLFCVLLMRKAARNLEQVRRERFRWKFLCQQLFRLIGFRSFYQPWKCFFHLINTTNRFSSLRPVSTLSSLDSYFVLFRLIFLLYKYLTNTLRAKIKEKHSNLFPLFLCLFVLVVGGEPLGAILCEESHLL